MEFLGPLLAACQLHALDELKLSCDIEDLSYYRMMICGHWECSDTIGQDLEECLGVTRICFVSSRNSDYSIALQS